MRFPEILYVPARFWLCSEQSASTFRLSLSYLVSASTVENLRSIVMNFRIGRKKPLFWSVLVSGRNLYFFFSESLANKSKRSSDRRSVEASAGTIPLRCTKETANCILFLLRRARTWSIAHLIVFSRRSREHEPFSLERNTSSRHPEEDLLGKRRHLSRPKGSLPFGPAVSQKGLHFPLRKRRRPQPQNLTCPTFLRLFSFSLRNVKTCAPETLPRNNLA